MAALLNLYNHILDSGDPRIKDWTFMTSPVFTIGVTALYLHFVTIVGPRLMRDHKPFNLKKLMIIYNFAMVIVSSWLFIETGSLINWGRNSFQCQTVDYSPDNPKAVKMLVIGWYFLISKFIELTDTIFFVLRKKQSQVTLLHVLHHSVVPITVWVGLKYAAGGNNAFFPFLNSFVHTVMYTYYGLSSLGPHMQRYLKWKKYLTILQMAQFILAIVHGLRALFQDCEFPQSFIFINLFHAVLFFYLFSSFYRNSYKKGKSSVELNTTIDSAEASAVIGDLKLSLRVSKRIH